MTDEQNGDYMVPFGERINKITLYINFSEGTDHFY